MVNATAAAELAAYSRKHAARLAKMTPAERKRALEMRAKQIAAGSGLPAAQIAAHGRQARAQAQAWRRFLLSGVEGTR